MTGNNGCIAFGPGLKLLDLCADFGVNQKSADLVVVVAVVAGKVDKTFVAVADLG